MANNELDVEQSLQIRLMSQIFSAFSILGSFLVFSTYWFFKENRSFSLELVQYYAFSNLVYSLSAYIPYNANSEHPDMFCALQSFTITMFQNACLLWSSIIAYSAFINIINKNHFESHKSKYRIFFILVSYLFTGGVASM